MKNSLIKKKKKSINFLRIKVILLVIITLNNENFNNLKKYI